MVERKPLPTLCRQNQCYQSENWVSNDIQDDPPLFSQVPQHYFLMSDCQICLTGRCETASRLADPNQSLGNLVSAARLPHTAPIAQLAEQLTLNQ